MCLFAEASIEELAIVAVHASSKMKKLDWMERHAVWAIFVSNKPHQFCVLVAQQFGPDELLHGWATGAEAPAVIVLPYRRKVQTTLDRWVIHRID